MCVRVSEKSFFGGGGVTEGEGAAEKFRPGEECLIPGKIIITCLNGEEDDANCCEKVHCSAPVSKRGLSTRAALVRIICRSR